MSILEERTLMHSLTHITSSPCSRLASYCTQLSSTLPLSLFLSVMACRTTRSHSPISHACESALTRPPQLHLLINCLTPCPFHPTAISCVSRDNFTCPTTRPPNWMSFAPAMITASLATLASPRQSRKFVASSIGPRWLPL